MSTTSTLVNQLMAQALKPDPKLYVDEWADGFRVLPRSSSSEPGLYRTDRTPYMREIMRELSTQSEVDTVVLMKGAQVGATEIGMNWIGSIIAHTPGPTLLIMPTLELAKRTSKNKIDPMIESTPALKELVADKRSRDAGNSMFIKEFPGGQLVMAGSNSAVGLRSMAARFVMLDEVSAFVGDADGEGDPVALTLRRTATFKRHRKIFMLSTPTIKGACRIEQEFERTDKRYYHVECPFCNVKERIKWENIKWDKDEQGNHLPDTAYLKCEHCGAAIEEHHKTKLLAGGEWIATASGEKKMAGFHLSSLYAPLGWYSWSDAVRDFLEAKKKADIGDTALLKTWTNTVVGETWASKGTEVSPHAIYRRREEYQAEVPDGVLVLVAGVDVQQDRIETTIYGFGRNEECWAIDSRIFWGDPSDLSSECWKQLEQLIYHGSYQHQNGLDLKIQATAIDSAFLTTQVYEFGKKHARQNVFCVMGEKSGKEGVPVVGRPSEKRTGRDRRPVRLWNLGTFEGKRLIYARLMLKERGGGFIHFPTRECFDEEFFEQLTAERIVERIVKGFTKREFVKIRNRNEQLDILVYAYSAFLIYRPNIAAFEKHFEDMVGQSSGSSEPTEPTPQPMPHYKPKMPQVPGRSWKSGLRNKPFR